jgi:hypothetical protein
MILSIEKYIKGNHDAYSFKASELYRSRFRRLHSPRNPKGTHLRTFGTNSPSHPYAKVQGSVAPFTEVLRKDKRYSERVVGNPKVLPCWRSLLGRQVL